MSLISPSEVNGHRVSSTLVKAADGQADFATRDQGAPEVGGILPSTITHHSPMSRVAQAGFQALCAQPSEKWTSGVHKLPVLCDLISNQAGP